MQVLYCLCDGLMKLSRNNCSQLRLMKEIRNLRAELFVIEVVLEKKSLTLYLYQPLNMCASNYSDFPTSCPTAWTALTLLHCKKTKSISMEPWQRAQGRLSLCVWSRPTSSPVSAGTEASLRLVRSLYVNRGPEALESSVPSIYHQVYHCMTVGRHFDFLQNSLSQVKLEILLLTITIYF